MKETRSVKQREQNDDNAGAAYHLFSTQEWVHDDLSNVKNKLSVCHFIVILNNNKSVYSIKQKLFDWLSIYIVLVKQSYY